MASRVACVTGATGFLASELVAQLLARGYTVQATDCYRAQRDALEMSVSSPYDNVRIPDLTRRVIAQ